MAIVTKHIINTCQGDKGDAVLTNHFIIEAVVEAFVCMYVSNILFIKVEEDTYV